MVNIYNSESAPLHLTITLTLWHCSENRLSE